MQNVNFCRGGWCDPPLICPSTLQRWVVLLSSFQRRIKVRKMVRRSTTLIQNRRPLYRPKRHSCWQTADRPASQNWEGISSVTPRVMVLLREVGSCWNDPRHVTKHEVQWQLNRRCLKSEWIHLWLPGRWDDCQECSAVISMQTKRRQSEWVWYWCSWWRKEKIKNHNPCSLFVNWLESIFTWAQD